jgi:Protein of unknown function (DUF1353)
MSDSILLDYTDTEMHMHRKRDKPGFRFLDKDCWVMGVLILAGFMWDGASTPKLFRWLVAKFDHSVMSSGMHDKLCGEAKNKGERKRADKLYRRALVVVEEFSEFDAWRAYVGVRTGAWWGTGVRYPHYIKDNIWPLLGIK